MDLRKLIRTNVVFTRGDRRRGQGGVEQCLVPVDQLARIPTVGESVWMAGGQFGDGEWCKVVDVEWHIHVDEVDENGNIPRRGGAGRSGGITVWLTKRGSASHR